MAKIPIYGTLSNETPEGKLVVAAQIFDETEEKKQSDINAETVRTTEQTLEEAQKEQVKKNIGLPIYAYFNDSSQEEQKKSGVSIDFRIFQEDTKNQVGNASIALGAMNKNMGVLSVTLGYQNVTSDGFGEGMGMMPGSFFMGSMLSDHDNDTFSAIGYRNNSVYKDSPESKRVGSYLTISVPYPYEHDIYGKNLVVFGTDENLYIHGIGGYDGGSLNGEAPILAEHKSLQEVLTDLDTRCPTAVEDGKTYGWKDGKWVELTAPAGGWNRNLYEIYGMKFNENTGYYEANGLVDITETQAALIARFQDNAIAGSNLANRFQQTTARTIIPLSSANLGGTTNLNFMAYFCPNLEVFKFDKLGTGGVKVSNTDYMFEGCGKFKSITNPLNISDITDIMGLTMLKNCKMLRFCYLKNAAVDIELKATKYISFESLKYLVDNASGSEITIILHEEVYRKITEGVVEDWGAFASRGVNLICLGEPGYIYLTDILDDSYTSLDERISSAGEDGNIYISKAVRQRITKAQKDDWGSLTALATSKNVSFSTSE